MKKALRTLMKRTTFRFVSFYFLLILIPTLIFISLYVSALHHQAVTEQRYRQSADQQQNMQLLDQRLGRAERVTNTLQNSMPLLTLLENRYISASDEMYAYVSYIKPLLDSISLMDPMVTDLYVYRNQLSFIGNYGLVHNLRDMADYPYEVRPESASSSVSFLATDAGMLHLDENASFAKPQYVYLSCIYDQDYDRIIAVLELQLDVEKLLSPSLTLAMKDSFYLTCDDTSYPIIHSDRGYQLDVSMPMTALPPPKREQSDAQFTAKNLTITWYQNVDQTFAGFSTYGFTAALLLLLPMLLFCMYVYRFTLRITRFSAHIHATNQGLPVPYEGQTHDDEFGDVVRDYNAMTKNICEQVDSMQEAERLKNAANYYAMSSQVNPHFMFNTLENIRMHVEMEHYDEAAQLLYTLGHFLRHNISMRGDSHIEEEMEHVGTTCVSISSG